MKIRNKRTGEIVEDKFLNYVLDDVKPYKSIAEFIEDWEDFNEDSNI